MAALYLHNALHVSDPRTTPSPHNRNSSIVSGATLHTSTTFEHSHPTEPLLHDETLETAAYRDLLSQQPIYADARRATHLSLVGNPVTFPLREKTSIWYRQVRRRYSRLKLIKGLVGILLGELQQGT